MGYDRPIEQAVEEAEALPPAEDLGTPAAELLGGDRNE
jgi:hypothetical protein